MAIQELVNVGAAQINPEAARALLQNLLAGRGAPAAAPMPRPQSQLRPEAVAQLLAALGGGQVGQPVDNGVAVVDKSPTRGGEVPAGFKSASIDPGDTFTFEIIPPALFKPRRLLFAKTTSPNFELVSLTAGMDSLMITADPINCEVFSDESFNQGWKIDTLQIGQPLRMVVRNISGTAGICSGAWLGLYAT
jgi:hypothetical protein